MAGGEWGGSAVRRSEGVKDGGRGEDGNGDGEGLDGVGGDEDVAVERVDHTGGQGRAGQGRAGARMPMSSRAWVTRRAVGRSVDTVGV